MSKRRQSNKQTNKVQTNIHLADISATFDKRSVKHDYQKLPWSTARLLDSCITIQSFGSQISLDAHIYKTPRIMASTLHLKKVINSNMHIVSVNLVLKVSGVNIPLIIPIIKQ